MALLEAIVSGGVGRRAEEGPAREMDGWESLLLRNTQELKTGFRFGAPEEPDLGRLDGKKRISERLIPTAKMSITN
jgi:hypothetical protein